ncbi:MAG: SLC13 family permease [Anaerolineae bacterium]|nr:SLC13 family permease [Anaerolineae bacterium]
MVSHMFTSNEIILIVIILAALVLILSNRVRLDIIGILVLLALSFTGVVTPDQAISGFSSEAVIVIIGLFIISRGLEDTGIVQWVADRLREIGKGSETRLVTMIMGAGALLSLIMSTVAAGAVLLPAAVQVGRDSNVRPSRLLIPLAFGTLAGGMATYFTSAHIIVSGILLDQHERGLNMLDFLPTGGVITLTSLLYMVLIGRRFLPDRESLGQKLSSRALSRNLYETYQLEERLWEYKVPSDSRLAGTSLKDSHIGGALGVTVLAIWRGQHAILSPTPDQTISVGDYLLVLGREERVNQLSEWGLTRGRENGGGPSHNYPVDLTEVIIPPRAGVLGRTLTELNFRSKFGLTTVALWREGRSYRTDVGKFPLQVGDALLMVGAVSKIKQLANERDYMVMQSSHASRPPRPQKARWALVITAAVLFAGVTSSVPIAEAMLAGAVAMALTGCLSMEDAYRSVEWKAIFLIAGMLPLSLAMVNTGLADRLSAGLIGMLSHYGALVMIGGLCLVTIVVTQGIGAQVTALILTPIAIRAALEVGISPQAMAVAVATASSTAYLTPIAHPVNILMMGPGGYTPGDFYKVGIGMTVITFVMLMLGMALFWGIR